MVDDTPTVALEHCYIVALGCLYHGHGISERAYEMCDWTRERALTTSTNFYRLQVKVGARLRESSAWPLTFYCRRTSL